MPAEVCVCVYVCEVVCVCVVCLQELFLKFHVESRKPSFV